MISVQTRFAFVARENRCAPATSAGQAFSGSCSSGKDAGPSSQERRFESGRELQQARRQVGPRHGILIPASAGSNPAALTNAHRGASAGKGPALIRPERRIRPPHQRPFFEASTLSDFVYQLRRSVVDRENAGQHRESGPTSFRFCTGVKLKWTSVGLQNRRLQVRGLPLLPVSVISCRVTNRRRMGQPANITVENRVNMGIASRGPCGPVLHLCGFWDDILGHQMSVPFGFAWAFRPVTPEVVSSSPSLAPIISMT
jgi:hypothetical protein